MHALLVSSCKRLGNIYKLLILNVLRYSHRSVIPRKECEAPFLSMYVFFENFVNSNVNFCNFGLVHKPLKPFIYNGFTKNHT
jgi:hypothetical protein